LRYTHSVTRELFGKPLKSPMLEHANRARLLPHDLGDVGHFKPGEDTEQDYFCLARGKRGDARQRNLGLVGGEDGGFGVVGPGSLGECIEACGRAAQALSSAPMIDQPPPGDREKPTPKRPFITLETVETRDRIEPCLRGEILAVIRLLHPEVPQKARVELPVESRECPLRPRPRSGEHRSKLLPERHSLERSG
jgi:hypothetical protein